MTMQKMTSRQRVWKTVNHQIPDRVPIDLGGMGASGIAVSAYDRLKRYLGLRTPSRVGSTCSMIAVVEEEVLRRFHVDTVPLDLAAIVSLSRPASEWVPRRLFDGTEVLLPPGTNIAAQADGSWVLLQADGSPSTFVMPKDGFYFDDLSFNKSGRIDTKNFRLISDIPDERLELLRRYGRSLYENTDYALLGWGCGISFLGMSWVTSDATSVTQGLPDEWMIMLMTEKDACHEMMDRAVDATIQCLKLAHEAVGDYCFAWGIGSDDSGTQRREFIQPRLWAEMIKPHYKQLCDWIHTHTAWKTFLHSCGSVRHLLPHFIEAGVDILNPVQTSAANMDPAQLKGAFGERLVFWGGGCDTQRLLDHGTPEEIRAQVRQRLEVFSPGGGYVFNQVHNIQANVPPENIVAMLDTAYEHGWYNQ
jgi:hypothetical protein